jgi:hypothetical protein
MTTKAIVTLFAVLAVPAAVIACSDEDCAETGSCGDFDGGRAASGGIGGTSGTGGSSASGGTGGGGASGTGGASGDGGGAGGSSACNDECSGSTPVCKESDGTCVQCTGMGHCTAPTSICNTSTNTCVECLTQTDCTEATASRCVAGECMSCQTKTDCAHIAGKGACDGTECVQCTEEDAAACGGNPCNPVTKVCSAFGTNRRPCESCDTDANCANADHFCVPMQYMGADRVGGYCLQRDSGTCEGPYSVGASGRTTLSGVTGTTFCTISEALVTCEAVRALLDTMRCPNGNECPESGLCRRVGTVNNVCTYACGAVLHCPPDDPLNTCGASSGSTYCGWQSG